MDGTSGQDVTTTTTSGNKKAARTQKPRCFRYVRQNLKNCRVNPSDYAVASMSEAVTAKIRNAS